MEKLENHIEAEKKHFDKLYAWKWTITGGILVVSWLFSHDIGAIITKLL